MRKLPETVKSTRGLEFRRAYAHRSPFGGMDTNFRHQNQVQPGPEYTVTKHFGKRPMRARFSAKAENRVSSHPSRATAFAQAQKGALFWIRMMKLNIDTLDLIIVVAYLLGIVGIGCGVGLRHRRQGGAGRDYFLAGGALTWPMIGLALFSTNISTVHLVSLAEQGYTNGLVFGNTEWMAAAALVVLSLFFVPLYIRSRVATLPDFLEQRYSRASRNWLALMSIISAVFIHIGFTIYAAAAVLEGLFGLNLYVSIVGVAVLTGLYTIVGGLLAVVVTETIQTIVLLIGAVILTAAGYSAVGGWEGLSQHVEPVKLTMLRPMGDPSGMPWYAALLGYPVIGIWYWCTDQTIVQRVLGAKDENHARIGPLFAGFIKILPVFILILPGLMCAALIQQGKLPEMGSSRETYAHLVQHLLPTGLTGVMAAALLAAAMSTVSGALNSIATLFSYDLYRSWRPQTSDRQLIIIGRIVTFVGMILAIAWSPFIGQFKTIFDGFAAMICYLAPPIFAVFVLGVFWKRASSRGALVTLIGGSLLGLLVFGLDFFGVIANALTSEGILFHVAYPIGLANPSFSAPGVHEGWALNFWMAGFWLGIVCLAIHVMVSWWTPEELDTVKSRLVWDHPFDALRSPGWPGIGNYKLLAAVLLAAMLALYILFA